MFFENLVAVTNKMNNYLKASQQAKKELDKEKVNKIKELILANLKKIDETQLKIRELQKELKLLKQDQADIEKGKVKSIIERQEKSKLAKETSVFDSSDKAVLQGYLKTISGTGSNFTTSGTTDTMNALYCHGEVNPSDLNGTYTWTNSGGENKEYYLST
jgi:hypothetical protein